MATELAKPPSALALVLFQVDSGPLAQLSVCSVLGPGLWLADSEMAGLPAVQLCVGPVAADLVGGSAGWS